MSLCAPFETILTRFARRFPAGERLASDPVQFPRRYAGAADREAAALLAALLAYGRVGSLLAKTEEVLGVLGPHPSRWIRTSTPRRTLQALSGWRHRWTTPHDIAYLLEGIRGILNEEGSLERAFKRGWSGHEANLRSPLIRFHRRLRDVDPRPIYGRGAGLRTLEFLLADPGRGSPLKRWNLFLRWVVRPDDGVDLGLWRGVLTRQLTIPLDTHVHRIAFALGLTRRTSPSWETAEEVTESLARVDPGDPVRFDFALAHLGISGACKGYQVPAICRRCDLAAICTLPARPLGLEEKSPRRGLAPVGARRQRRRFFLKPLTNACA